jgi:hypothetical protein
LVADMFKLNQISSCSSAVESFVFRNYITVWTTIPHYLDIFIVKYFQITIFIISPFFEWVWFSEFVALS